MLRSVQILVVKVPGQLTMPFASLALLSIFQSAQPELYIEARGSIEVISCVQGVQRGL